MSDITKDDIRYAIQDMMGDFKNDFVRMREQVERIDKRTDETGRVQLEMRDVSRRLQDLSPRLESVFSSGAFEQLQRDVDDVKTRTQNIERGISAITSYLQSLERTGGNNSQNIV